MGDDGTMARGTGYTTEFRAKAVRLPSESRASYSSGERDTDDGVGFLRGEARPDTALMAAYIDEHAALKCMYLTVRSLDPTGKGRIRWSARWKPALNAFAITFADRWPSEGTQQ